MKSIMAILLALIAMVSIGAAANHGGDWIQDQAFLAGSGMEYTTIYFDTGEMMVQVETPGIDATTMENFATSTMASNLDVKAVYFPTNHTIYFADGTVKTDVTLPDKVPLSWFRFTHTLF
jgi:hypothetical protein